MRLPVDRLAADRPLRKFRSDLGSAAYRDVDASSSAIYQPLVEVAGASTVELHFGCSAGLAAPGLLLASSKSAYFDGSL